MIIDVPQNIITLSVSSLQIASGNVNMYSVDIRNLLENHLEYLKSLFNTNIVALDPKKEQIYRGDFYGLLINTQNVQQDMFWVTMRMNGLYSSIDYSGDLGKIFIPNRSDVERLLTRHLNTTTI